MSYGAVAEIVYSTPEAKVTRFDLKAENENLCRDMEVAARHTAVPSTPGSSAYAALIPGAAGPAGRINERSGRRS